MSQIVMITAIGPRDRPGIIAALTEAVYVVGGNLDDATMTRLHGAFANMLSARVENDGALVALREKLDVVALALDLNITVDLIPDAHEDELPDHQINVYGADRPGIVFEITKLLSQLGVNITDLDTRLAGAPGRGIYVMLLETNGGDWDIVPQQLADVAQKLGVEVSIREIQSEAL
jgi:glycine cleavage system transcriptional repressor